MQNLREENWKSSFSRFHNSKYGIFQGPKINKNNPLEPGGCKKIKFISNLELKVNFIAGSLQITFGIIFETGDQALRLLPLLCQIFLLANFLPRKCSRKFLAMVVAGSSLLIVEYDCNLYCFISGLQDKLKIISLYHWQKYLFQNFHPEDIVIRTIGAAVEIRAKTAQAAEGDSNIM